MLKVSRLTDYGIVLLGQMLNQTSPNTVALSAKELSKSSGLPLPTVSKVLKILSQAGLILAKRGIHGGYNAANTLEQTSLLSIIEIFEGPTGITNCLDKTQKLCQLDHKCPQKNGWHLIDAKIKILLNQITLRDFISYGQ